MVQLQKDLIPRSQGSSSEIHRVLVDPRPLAAALSFLIRESPDAIRGLRPSNVQRLSISRVANTFAHHLYQVTE